MVYRRGVSGLHNPSDYRYSTKHECKVYLHQFRVVDKLRHDTIIRGSWGYRLPIKIGRCFARYYTITYDVFIVLPAFLWYAAAPVDAKVFNVT